MDNSISLSQKIGKAFFWNSLLFPAMGITTFIGSIFIARFLSLEAFGIYAISTAAISTFLSYSDFGIATALSKFLPEIMVKEDKNEAEKFLIILFFLRMCISIFCFFIILIFIDSLSSLLKIQAQYHFIFYFIGFIFIFDSIYLFLQNILWSTFEQKKANFLSIFFSGLQPLLIVLFILAQKGVRGILWAMLICSFLRMILFFIACMLKIRNLEDVKTAKEFSFKSYVVRLTKLALSSYFVTVVDYFASVSFITLILAYFLDKREVAIFALAAEFVMRFLSFSLTPTHGWILPLFSTVFGAQDHLKSKKTFSSAIKIITLLSVPLGGFLFAFSDRLIPLLYSEKFLASIPLTNILIIFIFLTYSTLAVSNATLLSGENLKHFLSIRIISGILIPLYFIVIPHFGLIGVSYFFGGTRLIISIFLLLATIKIYDFKYPYVFCGKIFFSVIVSCISVEVVELFVKQSIISFVTEIILFSAIFLALLKAVRLIDKSEKDLIKRLDVPILKYILRYA